MKFTIPILYFAFLYSASSTNAKVAEVQSVNDAKSAASTPRHDDVPKQASAATNTDTGRGLLRRPTASSSPLQLAQLHIQSDVASARFGVWQQQQQQQQQLRSLQDTGTCEDPALKTFPEYYNSRAVISADGNVAAFLENTNLASTVRIFAKTVDGSWPDAATHTIALRESACTIIQNSAAFDAETMTCVETLNQPGCAGIEKVFVLNTALNNKEGHRDTAAGLPETFDMIFAEPRTLAIDSCLSSIFPDHNPAYIGATDEISVTGGTEGDFYWESDRLKFWTGGQDGSLVDFSYTKWKQAKPEPNNNDGGLAENCVSRDSEGWNDVVCTKDFPAIYENRKQYSLYHSIALSADGKTLAVGASSGEGKVRIFGIPTDAGTDPTDLASFDYAGTGNGQAIAVSDNGQIIAMAAPSHKDGDNNEIGAVRVYKQDSSATSGWAQLGTNPILGSINDRIAFNEFGRPGALTMARNGNDLYLAITGRGSEGDSDGGNVRIFKFSGDLENGYNSNSNLYDGEWVQDGPAIYSEDNDGSSTLVGDISILSDGNLVVALGSARADDTDDAGNAVIDPGRVRTYLRCEYSGWAQLGNTITGTNPNDELGRTLRLSSDGTILAVGSREVYYQVYQLDATDSANPVWALKKQIDNTDGSNLDFGDYIDMSADGKYILIGDDERMTYDVSSCMANAATSIPNFCPTDSDHDGVPDYLDQCPTEGGFIHTNGCPIDSDNDGVKDCVSTSSDTSCHSTTELTTLSDLDACCNIEQDFCPDDTPTGARVNKQDATITKSTGDTELIKAGCPFDTDLDEVLDGLDRCPATTDQELQLVNSQSSKISVDDQGCAILSAFVWESTFIQESPVVSTRNGMPHIDMLFTVDKDLYAIANAQEYPSLVNVQVMDASCINVFDDLTDAGDKRLSAALAINNKGLYTGELPTDSTPVTVGLDFDTDKLFGSKVWKDEPNGVASISLCLKFSVLSYTDTSDANTAETVTYKDIKTSILLDTEQDFSVIGSKIKLDEAGAAEKTIDIDYPLAACRCDKDDVCVDSTSVLFQSDSLKICVRFASDDSVSLPPDYVKMTDVKSFTCKQGSISMQPVDNFVRQGIGGQLTSVEKRNIGYGADDRMLIVNSRLLGSFYGPRELPVDCTGTIVYEFAPVARALAKDGALHQRNLHESSVSLASGSRGHRRGAEDAAEAEFAVEIVLAKTKQGIGLSATAGAAIAIASAFAVASVAAVAVIAVVGPRAVMTRFARSPKGRYQVNDDDATDGATEATEAAEPTEADEGALTDVTLENSPFCPDHGSVA